jgi:uncharacterized protein (TIGR01777 family)
MSDRRVLVSAPSGLLGSALVRTLRDGGDSVTTLVRRPRTAEGEISWDPAAGVLDPAALGGFDIVVHLSGAGIADQRWTPERKKLLYDSRIDSTRLLVSALAEASSPPRLLISASAIGVYGSRGDEVLSEESRPGDDFFARLCLDWEAAARSAELPDTRVINVRSGLVMDSSRGLLEPILPLFRLGLGGKIGDGSQWMSWIAIDDHIAAMLHLMESERFGPVNLTAPNPVTNAEFTKLLGAVLGRPIFMVVPRFAVEARFGREAAALTAFASLRVEPGVLLDDGFTFGYPTLDAALAHVLGQA